MSTDRFGWHPGEATVKLVEGVRELPDTPPPAPPPVKKPVKKQPRK